MFLVLSAKTNIFSDEFIFFISLAKVLDRNSFFLGFFTF